MATTTIEVEPDKTKLLKRAARIHRDFLREVEELHEETRRLAKDGWARPNYCKHGTFIGDPYGADYMCGACEDGISDLEYALGIAHSQFNRQAREYNQALLWLGLLGQNLNDLHKSGALAIGTTGSVLREMRMYIESAQSFEKTWL